jgi:hypothetical protein
MSLRAELVRLGLRWFIKRKIGPATTLEALRRQDAFLERLVPPGFTTIAGTSIFGPFIFLSNSVDEFSFLQFVLIRTLRKLACHGYASRFHDLLQSVQICRHFFGREFPDQGKRRAS